MSQSKFKLNNGDLEKKLKKSVSKKFKSREFEKGELASLFESIAKMYNFSLSNFSYGIYYYEDESMQNISLNHSDFKKTSGLPVEIVGIFYRDDSEIMQSNSVQMRHFLDDELIIFVRSAELNINEVMSFIEEELSLIEYSD